MREREQDKQDKQKKEENLCLVHYFFVVRSFLEINLITLESRFISLLNGATYVRKIHLWVELQN